MMSMEDDRRGLAERKRNILFLICQYLSDMSLLTVRDALIKDTNLPINNYELCDNMDLNSIYLEYCSYFELKFGKMPKIIKRFDANNDGCCSTIGSISYRKMANVKRKLFQQIKKNDSADEQSIDSTTTSLNSALTVHGMQRNDDQQSDGQKMHSIPPLENCIHFSPEWKDMANVVCRDMIKKSLDVRWSHVKGHNNIQSILIESVLMPLEFPHLFTGVAKPWKCILLHGPPGTGKTLLARALCSETRSKVAFFSVSSSTVVSKWRGDSEKYVRVLFEVAKYYAPSIVFIDEFEGLSSKRDAMCEHEASKRFKNEFLTQIDKIDEDNVNVLILANTNLPWELDPAFLRRFEKKLLVGLPEREDRFNMLKHFLPEQNKISVDEMMEIAKMTDGFSGDEIRVACKEASMVKIRNAIKAATKNERSPENQLQLLTAKELKDAVNKIIPMCKNILEKHIKWNTNFGTQSYI